MEYQELLKAWGLEAYISTFEDEGITDESFTLLDEATIKSIFKRIGPQLIFRKHFNAYTFGKSSDANPKIMADECQTDSLSNASTETVVSQLTNTSSENQYEFEVDESFFKELEEETHNNNNIKTIFKVPEVPASTSKDSTEFNSPMKKIRKDSIFPYGLEKYLSENPEGKLILSCKAKLTGFLRQKLAKVIVAYLVARNLENSNYEIKSEVFRKAAQEIVQLFPTEKEETYYIPFTSNKGGLRQPARGKLWSRYINVKAALRAAEGNRERSPSNREAELDLDNSQYLFLKSAIEPYHKVLEAWELTTDFRTTLHKNSTLENIYNDFPVLKTDLGIQLLELDFNNKNEDKIDVIYAEWPKVALAIINEASERQTRNYEDILDNSTRALLTLPFLFSPTTIKKSAKNAWRPTRIEVQESFFFIEKSLDDLDIHLERRKAKLDAYDLPLQPFGVGIGEKLESLEGFYVVINECKYKCDSSIRCLELLYKSIHALRLQYPPESKQIFLMIQELVFKMGSSGKSGSTAGVISDLLFHLNKGC